VNPPVKRAAAPLGVGVLTWLCPCRGRVILLK